MNILIYFGNQLNPLNGGTERVACMIADYILNHGHTVIYLASIVSSGSQARESFFLPDSTDGPTEVNINFLNNLIIERNIDIIINEGASSDSVYLFSHEHIKKSIKIISHLHFNILGDIHSFYRLQYLPIFNVPVKEKTINILKFLKQPYNKWRALRNKHRRYDYMHKYSDKIVVLSEKQKILLNKFLKKSNSNKIIDIVNPLTFNLTSNTYFHSKKKQIIFVGRLEYSTKRVDRILKIWYNINECIPEWKLKIIGSGPDENRLQNLSKRLSLKNIEFVGKQDPEPFYKDASILLLSSNHEGTPMVIPEAMSYGVVPIVMNNFSDADMYISNGLSGFVTKPFDNDDMAQKIVYLARNPHLIRTMADNCLNQIRKIKNDNLLDSWAYLINEG